MYPHYVRTDVIIHYLVNFCHKQVRYADDISLVWVEKTFNYLGGKNQAD